MGTVGETSVPDDSGSHHTAAARPPSWAYLHKPIIVLVMGSMMCTAGGLLFLLQSSEASRSVASACVSIGLLFAVMGLVWIPILKEKRTRKRYAMEVEPVMEKSYDGVGRCKCSFWFAVAHDILGIFIMMVGVFGGLVVHDLFIYAGAVIIFLSLIWWVFWYSGNIDVPPEELEDDVGMIKLKNRGLSRAVRRVSGQLSSRIRSSFRKNGRSFREENSRPSDTGADVTLSTIYNSTIASSSSKEFYRETLSI